MNDFVFLFDADGVINPFPTEKFSDRVIKDFPNDKKIVDFFNDGTYLRCKKGELLLENVFPKYLEGTIFEGNLEKILDYWHKGDNGIDTNILGKITKLRDKGYKVYLGTNQPNTRTDFMINKLNLGIYFDEIIASCYIKAVKPEKEFFSKTFDIINSGAIKYKKEQILFFDDKQENIVSGNDFGFESYLYKSIDDLNKVLTNKKIII